MVWLVLAIASYFLNAIVSLVDKFLLSERVKNAFAYAFYSGVLSAVAFFLWPFDFSFLSLRFTLISFFAGATFFGANYFYYSAVFKGEVSSVVPIVGGISPAIILILSYFFLDERFPAFWILGFLALILGTVLFTLGKDKKVSADSFVAAIFFAFSFFLSKAVFLETGFLNGFAWTRTGAVLVPVALCFFPFFRKALRREGFGVRHGSFPLFLSNKGLSAGAFLLLNYSISLGSVAVVNAVQGVQYVFLFLLTLAFSVYFPWIVKESLRPAVVVRKALGIVLVSCGIIILFVA